MFPEVPLPEDVPVKRPIELTLKPGWRYDSRRQTFVGAKGDSFSPKDALPSGSRIAYQVPDLAGKDPAELSKPERELQRYIHVVLPSEAKPEDYVAVASKWPCVAAASVAPEISLP